MEELLICSVIITLPLWIGLIWLIDRLILNVYVKHNAPSQKLMFCQLKEDDYIFKAKDGILIYYIIENVEYKFDYKNKLESIKFCMRDCSSFGEYNNIEIPVKQAKSFEWGHFYTLYDMAKNVQQSVICKRNSQIESIKNVSMAELKAGVEEEIKHLNKLLE